jgi:eukaryotic-like serine/threonine-protein kinase
VLDDAASRLPDATGGVFPGFLALSTLPRGRLGKYELGEEIARGSTGVVFSAHDPIINRPVAIKVALSNAVRERAGRERYRRLFFNEAHTAGRLQHPNILRIFDAGIDDGTCYIVMELVAGGTTLRHYARTERLPADTVARLLFDCARALDYAHRQGVIHRDIKPSNVLVTPDLQVKIADFSIAHLLQADLTDTLPTGFIGSPRYMAPEQIQDDEVSPRTDIYSLGVLGYELLAGQHPFLADSFSRLVHAIVHESPPALVSLQPALPVALAAVISRAMEKDPRLRYTAALDLAADLSALFPGLGPAQDVLPLNRRFTLLRELDFYAEFTDPELWEVARAALWEEHAAGVTVMREGDVESAFYVVASGSVDVIKSGHVLKRLGPGACLGEMGWIRQARRTAAVRTAEPVKLVKMSAALIERLTKDCQLRLYRTLLRTLAERLTHTTGQVVPQ